MGLSGGRWTGRYPAPIKPSVELQEKNVLSAYQDVQGCTLVDPKTGNMLGVVHRHLDSVAGDIAKGSNCHTCL